MNSGKVGLTVLGILLLLAGGTFALQGAGYLGGSSMTGSSFWLYAGAVIAVVGLLLVVGAMRMAPRKATAPGASVSNAGM